MFTAPFTSVFIITPHDSQPYNPRSTRVESRFRPQHEHVLLVPRSLFRSTRMPCSSALYSSKRVKRSNSHGVSCSHACPSFETRRSRRLEYRSVTGGDATDLMVDALLNHVFGEGVQEVVFPSGQLLTGTERTARRPVLPFCVGLVTGEVVLVLFQDVPRYNSASPSSEAMAR